MSRTHKIFAGVLLLLIILGDARTRYRQTSESQPLAADLETDAPVISAAFTLADA